jgi:hypothetical protein
VPPVSLPFPVSALPGRRPGEGQGDLLNVFARKVGNLIRWQRVPGTTRFTPPMIGPSFTTFTPRGQLVVDNFLVSVWGDTVTVTLPNGDVTVLTGLPLPGVGPVTMARNMRQPTPDVVVVADGNAFVINLATNTVVAYPPSSEGATSLVPINSVDYFSGYFVFSRPNGYIVASELQQLDWLALSVARAEANPDGLLRMFSSQPVLLACGTETIELYQDVGSSPFPFQRVTVIPCGLLSTFAIAGGGSRWDRPLLWVAHDRTVRQLNGADPVIVSTEDVVSDIEEAVVNGEADYLYAQAYTHGPNAIWSLSSPNWTWEYNLSTAGWHRRQSYYPDSPTPERAPWRGYFTVRFDHRWLAQDAIDGGLLEVTSDAQAEPSIRRLRPSGDTLVETTLQAPLIARCESGPTKEVPANIRMAVIYLDFTVGFDVDAAPEPAVFISWSHDGGATWSNPLERMIGGKGQYRTMVQLRSTGRSSHHGVRVRWECVDPVPLAFHGALSPRTSASRPRQVGVVAMGGPE